MQPVGHEKGDRGPVAIPDYKTLMLPLLDVAAKAKGQEVKLSDAADVLAKRFRLTDKERTELLPSGGTFKFASRVSWARTYLQKAGVLEAPRRGYFRLTTRGAMILKQSPAKVDNKLLAQFEEFRLYRIWCGHMIQICGDGSPCAVLLG
jgi:restriction system protein